ncbi:hypothetical protein Pla8534_60860 [Lignipirellula cremea]|uniref:Uncharacterized protein n=1 Tax=Lignipirellula cremea TaxID=2528010 RepID=A0A518E2A4_9BACT|nr:hypothetical protein Pla8534_60860 [Lignipirellula cremea]
MRITSGFSVVVSKKSRRQKADLQSVKVSRSPRTSTFRTTLRNRNPKVSVLAPLNGQLSPAARADRKIAKTLLHQLALIFRMTGVMVDI